MIQIQKFLLILDVYMILFISYFYRLLSTGRICQQHFIIHNFPLSFWRYLNLKKRWSFVIKLFKSIDKNCIILFKNENRISGLICKEGAARF